MMCGAGTVGLEIMKQVRDVDVVVVPVGGGGLLAGITTVIKQINDKVLVIGVEPVGAAAMQKSLTAGHPVRLDKISSIADGLAAPFAGELTYPIIRDHADGVVLVTDDDRRRDVADLDLLQVARRACRRDCNSRLALGKDSKSPAAASRRVAQWRQRRPRPAEVTGMKRAILVAACAMTAVAALAAQQPALTADSGHFMLHGKPIQIISGEMHYARIPRAYWRDRLRKARAMGLNTISTYVFWNLHEPKPGQYDFTGEKDIAEYIRIARQEGLNVISRPEFPAPANGIWAATRPGSSPTRPCCSAARNRNSRPLPHAGSIGWARSSHCSCRVTADRSSPCRWITNTVRSTRTWRTWRGNATHSSMPASSACCSTPPTVTSSFLHWDARPSGRGRPCTGDADSSFARLARFRPGDPLMSG